jgi:hypothetical protein
MVVALPAKMIVAHYEGMQQQSVWHGIADFERDELHREILRTQGALTTRYQLDPLGRRLGSHAHRGTGLGVLPDNEPGITAHLPGIGATSFAKTYRYDPVGELRETHHPPYIPQVDDRISA